MLKLPGVVSRAIAVQEEQGSTKSSHPCRACIDYKLVRQLGRGSGGSVKLVWKEDHAMWSKMAMKVVSKWSLADHFGVRELCERDFLVRFFHDPLISSTNFIVRFRAAHQTSSNFYFFFDYYSGGDLLDHLQLRGPLSPLEVLESARQLTTAINYVHACGYLHNDVRLENILITCTGDLRLADFGSCYPSQDNYAKDWTRLATVIYEVSTGKRLASSWPDDEFNSTQWQEVTSLHQSLLSCNSQTYTASNQLISHAIKYPNFGYSYKGHSEDVSSACSEDVDYLRLREFSYQSI